MLFNFLLRIVFLMSKHPHFEAIWGQSTFTVKQEASSICVFRFIGLIRRKRWRKKVIPIPPKGKMEGKASQWNLLFVMNPEECGGGGYDIKSKKNSRWWINYLWWEGWKWCLQKGTYQFCWSTSSWFLRVAAEESYFELILINCMDKLGIGAFVMRGTDAYLFLMNDLGRDLLR